MLTEFQLRGAEAKRSSTGTLFYVENGYKALKGRREALIDETFFAEKVAAERAFRTRVANDPKLAAEYGKAWSDVEKAVAKFKELDEPYLYLEGGGRGGRAWGFSSDLFAWARKLVRAAEELPKPNEQRLREYSDGALPALKQDVLSTAPIHPELEVATLTFSLTKLRETLGPDDPFVKKVLGKESPAEVTKRVVTGSKLADPKVRKALFEDGQKAVAASKDPMIALARLVDADARALRKRYEEEVEAVQRKSGELIAKARFELFGTSLYPDATFTLRLSFGAVRGWEHQGEKVEPFTRIGGAFERHTGKDPFALPPSWLSSKAKLDLQTPFDFATTNDIIGGNSGSPVVNQKAEVVGLIFDGNIHSLGGDYGFDEKLNRAVAVHSAAIVEALSKVYGAQRLVDELRGEAGGGAPAAKTP